MTVSNETVVERFLANVEVVGVPTPPDAPPMTRTYMEARPRQDGMTDVILPLPAYKGDTGPAGPPIKIYSVVDETLIPKASTLSEKSAGKAWRVQGSSDIHLWNGDRFEIHQNWIGAEGPQGKPGPANSLRIGSIQTVPEHEEARATITGHSPDQVLNLWVPVKQGPQGDRGPTATIANAADADFAGRPPQSGDALVFNGDKWEPRSYSALASKTWTITGDNIGTDIRSNDDRRELYAFDLPAQEMPYRLDFTGLVRMECPAGKSLALEARLGDPDSGPIIGMARCEWGAKGWWPMVTYSDTTHDDVARRGVIPAGVATTVYFSLVKRQTISVGDWKWQVDGTSISMTMLPA